MDKEVEQQMIEDFCKREVYPRNFIESIKHNKLLAQQEKEIALLVIKYCWEKIMEEVK